MSCRLVDGGDDDQASTKEDRIARVFCRRRRHRRSPHSAAIHLVNREVTEDTYLAVIEQAFEMLAGPDDIAKFLASKLRASPSREFLDIVALMLDPKVDSYFKLVIERRRSGKTWTRRANDAALAKATIKYQRAPGNKRGSRKDAVAAVADCFGVSQATVRKALRSLNSK
jgi:hypothetical protein